MGRSAPASVRQSQRESTTLLGSGRSWRCAHLRHAVDTPPQSAGQGALRLTHRWEPRAQRCGSSSWIGRWRGRKKQRRQPVRRNSRRDRQELPVVPVGAAGRPAAMRDRRPGPWPALGERRLPRPAAPRRLEGPGAATPRATPAPGRRLGRASPHLATRISKRGRCGVLTCSNPRLNGMRLWRRAIEAVARRRRRPAASRPRRRQRRSRPAGRTPRRRARRRRRSRAGR